MENGKVCLHILRGFCEQCKYYFKNVKNGGYAEVFEPEIKPRHGLPYCYSFEKFNGAGND